MSTNVHSLSKLINGSRTPSLKAGTKTWRTTHDSINSVDMPIEQSEEVVTLMIHIMIWPIAKYCTLI